MGSALKAEMAAAGVTAFQRSCVIYDSRSNAPFLVSTLADLAARLRPRTIASIAYLRKISCIPLAVHSALPCFVLMPSNPNRLAIAR